MRLNASHIHRLPADERRRRLDDALGAVMDESKRIVRESKARRPDPRSAADYVSYRTMKMMAAAVVKHGDRPASIEVSRDGGNGRRAFINPARVILQPESTDRLWLIVVSRSLAAWINEKQGVNLSAVPVELAASGEFTDEERKIWKTLNALAFSINSRIWTAGRRRPLLTRNQAA